MMRLEFTKLCTRYYWNNVRHIHRKRSINLGSITDLAIAIATPTLEEHKLSRPPGNERKVTVFAHLDSSITDDSASMKSTTGNTNNCEAFKTVAKITRTTTAGVAKGGSLRNGALRLWVTSMTSRALLRPRHRENENETKRNRSTMHEDANN
jgi:hypothetical protein